jgi:hypothetical protein
LFVINLAGVSVPRVLLPEVAERLIHAGFNATASKLLTASSGGGGVVDLTESERDEILAVLADPPPDLEELCRELRKERAAEATTVEESRSGTAFDALPAPG